MNHLHLPGVTTNFVSVPNVANLHGSGTLEFIAKVALDNWTLDADQVWISKWTGTAGYKFSLRAATNDLRLRWNPSRVATATVTPTVTDGDWLWVRAVATEDGVDRNVLFYTSTDTTDDPDLVTWTQLGAEIVVSFGAGDLITNTARVFVGALSATAGTMAGSVAAARINFNGVTELDIDFTDLTVAEVDAGLFTEDSGSAATVTIAGTAWAYVRPIQTVIGGAIVRFRSALWDNPLHQDLFRYVRARLMLNVPARYRIDPGNQEWVVFSDTRFTLDQIAAIGALAAYDLNDLPAEWQLPNDPETADREAAEAQIQALIDATWVPSDQIVYAEDDPNPWQTALDANGAPGDTKAGLGPDLNWRPVEGVA